MKFDNAPITEVVIGVQFEGDTISNECIVEFYQLIKEKFPNIVEYPILPTIIEKLDRPSETNILGGFSSRKFFINSKGSKLVQLQRNRLVFNWKKTTNNEEYPHFNNVLEEFMGIYARLNDLCNVNGKINQVEVTYLDHIVLADFREETYNPSSVFTILNIPIEEKIKHLRIEMNIPVPELNGVINCHINSATRHTDNEKILVLETTCRGALGEKNITEWYDAAHIKLLQVFKNYTTDYAKNIWGLKK